MSVSIAGKTHTGKKRSAKINEDSFFAEKINDIYFAAVCDGMGGVNGGNVASSLAVKAFAETVKTLVPGFADYADYKDILFAFAAKANDMVFSTAQNEKGLAGMGTTVVACIYDGTQYHAVNVGDSRMYIIDDKLGSICQVTKDHSLVRELVESGTMTKEQAEKSPNKNILTRVLGADDVVDVDYYSGKCEGGAILLCSDGLYNYTDESDMAKYISQYENIEHCANELIRKANENGGGDNITAVIIKPQGNQNI